MTDFFFPARCSVFQNTITTFNGVEFNYSMPASCYHVLVQDCSPELKFLVMMKRLEESADLTAINVRLASQWVITNLMTNRCQAEYAINVKTRLLQQIGTSIRLMQKLLMSVERFMSVTGIWDFVFQKCFWNISEVHSNLKSLLPKILH